MKPDLQKAFRVLDRTVLPEENRITGGDEESRVEPRAMAVLVCLACHAGEVVTRTYLDQQVWHGSVVTDHALTNCISELRRRLGDTCDTPRFIETVPKRGYRLIAPVLPLVDEVAPPGRPTAPDLLKVTLALLVLATLALAGSWWLIDPTAEPGETGSSRQSIAVLPFRNLSADKTNQYFVAGIRDLIITKLANVGSLKVIARSSSERYGSSPTDLERVAAELDVATILEGSVQKVGNEVLINLQLIDARDHRHLWARSYQRSLDNIFGVEGEVAHKIAAALHAELSPAEAARLTAIPTTDKRAYNLFLQAEYLFRRGFVNYETARWDDVISLYHQAIARDPDFALAYARLAYTESIFAWFGGGDRSPRQLHAQARADAERAVQLAPNLAIAHVAVGYNRYYGQQDYKAALRAFDKALALSPSNIKALVASGYVQRRQGRFDDAIASLKRALAIDPYNSSLTFETGVTLMMVSRYAQAENWFQKALALDPDNHNAKHRRARAILFRSGDVAAALTASLGDADQLKMLRTKLLTWQRRYDRAIAMLRSVPDRPAFFSAAAAAGGPKALQLARLHRLAGDRARARPLYRKALAQAHAALDQQQGIAMAFAWQTIAEAELGLGDRARALEALARSKAVRDAIGDRNYGPRIKRTNAILYALAGQPDRAVPLLAAALQAPGGGDTFAPVLLWLNPAWDSIRDNPRFRALLARYVAHKPDVTYFPSPDARVRTQTGNAASKGKATET